MLTGSPPLPRDGSGRVTTLEGELKLDDADYKNTQKLTWLAKTSHAPFTPTVCVQFDHLISKGIIKPDEDFKDFVNKESKVRVRTLKRGQPLYKGQIAGSQINVSTIRRFCIQE